jgi:hypothetical protein
LVDLLILTETVLFPIFLPFIGRSSYPDKKNLLSTSAYLSVGRPPYPDRKPPSCPPLLYTPRWVSWYFHLQKEQASTQISTGPMGLVHIMYERKHKKKKNIYIYMWDE